MIIGQNPHNNIALNRNKNVRFGQLYSDAAKKMYKDFKKYIPTPKEATRFSKFQTNTSHLNRDADTSAIRETAQHLREHDKWEWAAKWLEESATILDKWAKK